MELKVAIKTFDKKLIFDIFESQEIKYGMKKQVAPNLMVRSRGLGFKEASGFPDIIYLTFTIGTGIASGTVAGFLANWLYDKVRGRAEKIRIEGIDIQIDEGEIKRILIDKIEKSEG